jgi:DNA-binding NtrC family response regulator
MNSTPSKDQKMTSERQMRGTLADQEILDLPTVLVATIDPHIQQSIGELLKVYPIKVVWAKCVEELRSALTRENVSVCLCGFWLVDGTCRDVVRHVKRQPIATPVVMVCAPACPDEYRDYLAGLNILAFDFICYPYQESRVGEILQSAIEAHHESLRLNTNPPPGSARTVVGFSPTAI